MDDERDLEGLEDHFSVDDVLLFRALAERALQAAPERGVGGALESSASPDAKCASEPPPPPAGHSLLGGACRALSACCTRMVGLIIGGDVT